MQHIRRVVGAGIAFILILGAGTCLAQEGDPILATVNGQPILASTLENELYRRWGDIALGGLIQELAVKQAAAEAGISATADEIEDRADRFRRNIDMNSAASGGNFSMWLVQQKMTPYAFRQWIHTELLLEKMVEDQVSVTDEDVRTFWEQQKDRFRQPERMRVSHICVTDKDEAQRIRSEIIAGDITFEKAAEEYSIDPYTRSEGGAFGVITRGESAFQNAAFALQNDGAMTDPIQSEKGWHIIRREEHLPASTPSFEDVSEKLQEQLRQQKLMALMNKKRAEIMQDARIEQELDPDELAAD